MNSARFEEIRKKYRNATRKESDGDLLSLKVEIASFIKNLRAADEKNDLLAEAQGMLIDSTKIIEESRWHPFRPKKLML